MKQIIITILLCATALVGLRLATEPAEKAPQTVREAIEGRRSIRQYEDREVEREKLQQIAECGVLAPSAMNRQEWELRIVGSEAWIDRCTAAFVEQVKGTPLGDHLLTADFKNMFRNAPAVIFVAAKPSTYAGVNVGLLGEIALIVLVVLLFFGASRIPALFRSIGSGVKAFRDGVEGKSDDSAGEQK